MNNFTQFSINYFNFLKPKKAIPLPGDCNCAMLAVVYNSEYLKMNI